MPKKTALVVAPGRGTYNKDELGYLKRHHSDKKDLIAMADKYRQGKGQTTISDLDGADAFALKEHTRGDNASPLIYTCAYADFLSIDRDKFDIVAVTGNSMGWYIALGCGGALDEHNTLDVINTMGTWMQESLIGGQLIYTCVDENWVMIDGKRDELNTLIDKINEMDGCDCYLSIDLGGMIVFGGNDKALKELEKSLDVMQERFPFRLVNHAAFHTPLQQPISQKALDHFNPSMFRRAQHPLIDGRGHIWSPYSTDPSDICDYTFGHQVVAPYDFTSAIQVGMKEFAPDCVICLGPGTTLGGAIAQSLIQIKWMDMHSKDDFIKQQKSAPILYSMGMDDQRKLVA